MIDLNNEEKIDDLEMYLLFSEVLQLIAAGDKKCCGSSSGKENRVIVCVRRVVITHWSQQPI